MTVALSSNPTHPIASIGASCAIDSISAPNQMSGEFLRPELARARESLLKALTNDPKALYDELMALRVFCDFDRDVNLTIWEAVQPALVDLHILSAEVTMEAVLEYDPASSYNGTNIIRSLQVYLDKQLAVRSNDGLLKNAKSIAAHAWRDLSFFQARFWHLWDEVLRAPLTKQELGAKVVNFMEKGQLTPEETDALLRKIVSPKSVEIAYQTPFVEETFTPFMHLGFDSDASFQKRMTRGDGNCCFNALSLTLLGSIDEASYRVETLADSLSQVLQKPQEEMRKQIQTALDAYQKAIAVDTNEQELESGQASLALWNEAQRKLAPLLRKASIALLRNTGPSETVLHDLASNLQDKLDQKKRRPSDLCDIPAIQAKMHELVKCVRSGKSNEQDAKNTLCIWFLETGWSAYLNEMAKKGSWGGILELKAMSQAIGLHLSLVQLHGISLLDKELLDCAVNQAEEVVLAGATFTFDELAVLSELHILAVGSRSNGRVSLENNLMKGVKEYRDRFDLRTASNSCQRVLGNHMPLDVDPQAWLQSLQERFLPFIYLPNRPIIALHNPYGAHWSAISIDGFFDLRRNSPSNLPIES